MYGPGQFTLDDANKKNRLREPLEFPPIFEPILVLWPERSIYHPGQFTRDDAKGE